MEGIYIHSGTSDKIALSDSCERSNFFPEARNSKDNRCACEHSSAVLVPTPKNCHSHGSEAKRRNLQFLSKAAASSALAKSSQKTQARREAGLGAEGAAALMANHQMAQRLAGAIGVPVLQPKAF